MDENTYLAHDAGHGDEYAPVRRRLGRGLNALLGTGSEHEGAPVEGAGDLKHIPTNVIVPNPFQPRRDFDEETLAELAASIARHGILQPLLVRAHGTGYQLIAGERRWRAARRAGLPAVLCRVLELDDRAVFEATIEENLKRKDLGVLEKAQAFQDYLDRFGSTVEQLAAQLSLDRSTVSNYVRLLELPDEVKQALATEKITAGHARALLPLGHEDRVAVCRQVIAQSLSVRKTEAAVREILGRLESAAAAAAEIDDPAMKGAAGTVPFPEPVETVVPMISNHVLSLQDQLRDHFGAKVEIRVTGPETGKIIIHFQSNDDFERILRQLRRAA